MAREAREAALEARQVANEARNLALAHINGCERAYRDQERRLTGIDNKLDQQDKRSEEYRDKMEERTSEILEAGRKRYYATMGGAGSLGVMLAWQVYVYLHPYAH